MICDVCGRQLDGKQAKTLKPNEMRVIAQNGYGETVPILASLPLAERRSKFQNLTYSNDTDWALCQKCYDAARPYLSGANPRGMTESDADALYQIGIKPLMDALGERPPQTRANPSATGRAAAGDKQTTNPGRAPTAPGQQKIIDDIFYKLASGDVEGGRRDLLQLCANGLERLSLEMLIFTVLELLRDPIDREKAPELINFIQSHFPGTGAAERLIFAIHPNNWLYGHLWAELAPPISAATSKDVAGPHEEALRLLTDDVYKTFFHVVVLSVPVGAVIEGSIATGLMRGSVQLQLRSAGRAIDEFRRGAENPEKTAQFIREWLGKQYEPTLVDGGVSKFREAYLTGLGLALRDLGRFAEALAVWNKLKARPRFLIAEAQRLQQRPVPSAAWRAAYAENSAARSAKAQTPKAESKCFIATAACGCSTAWEVETLREFRDKILLRRRLGCYVIETYYRLSPPLARWIAGRPGVQRLVRRFFVKPLAQAAAKRIAAVD
jgi:hypothetical protein